MRNRCLALIAVASLATLVAAGQTPGKAKDAKSWKAPRTPDGVPDLQGYWTNSTLTPL